MSLSRHRRLLAFVLLALVPTLLAAWSLERRGRGLDANATTNQSNGDPAVAEYTANARSQAIAAARGDAHIRRLVAEERPTIVRMAPWTTGLPNPKDRFIGAVLTIDLGGPQTIDTVWPSWGCDSDERARGTLVHVVATNVVRPLLGVDVHTNRVLWIDPGPEATVLTWQRQGAISGFPPMSCDDDSPQL